MSTKQKIKYDLNFFQSLFAAPVILGALFKLQNWPAADGMLIVGLVCEAVIFVLLAFQPTTDTVNGNGSAAVGVAGNANIGGTVVIDQTSQQLNQMMKDADIGPELVKNLGEGLKTFGDKVALISNVTDSSAASAQLKNKMEDAAKSIEEFNGAYQKAYSSVVDFSSSLGEVLSFNEQLTDLSKNLKALNRIYELELTTSDTHLRSLGKFYENISRTVQDLNDSMEDARKYKEELSKLTQNMATLNAVYGNMLTAMNVPKAQ